MRNFQPLTCIATLLMFNVTASETVPCQSMFENSKLSDLSLTYEEFDQTHGQGFRVLAGQRCYKEAADLIEAYIDHNNATQSSLVWHIAQLRASEGNYAQALVHARKSLNPNENLEKNALRWNDYVHGVIAFLENDKPALVFHRNKVAQGNDEHYGNPLNTEVLDRLIRNFNQTYQDAVSL